MAYGKSAIFLHQDKHKQSPSGYLLFLREIIQRFILVSFHTYRPKTDLK